MSYIDGFVIPVGKADQAKVTDHALGIDKFFLEYGATRVVECWADDVPEGKVTSFRRAVQANDGETALFSWIEWPDKVTRDAAMKAMETNEAMMAEPMPFDGKRMIFGGFEPIVNERAGGTARGGSAGLDRGIARGNAARRRARRTRQDGPGGWHAPRLVSSPNSSGVQ